MPTDPFYTHPFDFDCYTERLRSIALWYPEFRLFSAGRSVLGKALWCLFVGNVSYAPVLLVGGIHGGEWLTSLLLTLFAEKLAHAAHQRESIAGVRADGVVNCHSLLILPCLNPDGIEISIAQPEELWQANARGVDLNHNFDAGWETLREMERASGITCPGPTRYGGAYPFSEPETQAIRELCRKYHVRQLTAFHSQGEEIYWQYGPRTPARSRHIAQLMAASTGYRICDPQGLASHGGMKDWFIQETGRPGFTIEIGKGKNPLPIKQLPELWKRLQELLMLSALF